MQNEQTDKGLYSIIVTLRKRLFVCSSSYLFVNESTRQLEYINQLVKPLNVAEVLTMNKVLVLRVHTYAALECTSYVRLKCSLE